MYGYSQIPHYGIPRPEQRLSLNKFLAVNHSNHYIRILLWLCEALTTSYLCMSILCYIWIFTARKRSLRMLCFYTCLSVILFIRGGGCLSQCMLRYTPGRYTPGNRHPPPGSRTPSGADTPPGVDILLEQTPPPPEKTPLRADTPPPEQTPPPKQTTPPGKDTPPVRSACWEIQPISVRYASYWNAHLCQDLLKSAKKIG